MDRTRRTDLGIIYAMLRASGIRSVDVADLDAYEVVEITDDIGGLFDCYDDHGPGLVVRFEEQWVADVAGLHEARAFIEDAAGAPIDLIREPRTDVPDRWIPVPAEHPAGTGPLFLGSGPVGFPVA